MAQARCETLINQYTVAFSFHFSSGPNIDDDRGSNGDDGGPPDEGNGDDRPGPSHRRPRPFRKRTAEQVAGEAMIGRLVEAVDGTCFSFS